MAKDFCFLFMPGDYLRDTQCLSEKAQVAYDRIMCEHIRNICITQERLNFFTKRLNETELSELMGTLIGVNGGYQIEWVALSINKRKAYSASRSDNRTGKKSKNGHDFKKTYVPHMENENEIDKGVIIRGGQNNEPMDPSINPKFRSLPIDDKYRAAYIANKITPELQAEWEESRKQRGL